MTYKVEFAQSAQDDADAAYLWIAEQAPEAATKWFNKLQQQVESLATHPKRCPLAPESAAFQQEMRQLLYGNYRLLFTLRGRTVHLLHVRHAAMQPIEPPPNQGGT